MRNIFKATGHSIPTLAILAMASSCSQDPILPIDSVREEYTHNFIREFGVPAPGHSYATAVRAGLKVTTKTGAYVRVTAVVDGKEYRFAQLTVPAGTHDLPVTIPAGVERLMIKTNMARQEVGINDLVDLDALGETPSSRGWNVTNTNDNLLQITDDKVAAPMISFKPSDFLQAYFEAHPIGVESTDYRYIGSDAGDGRIDPKLDPDNIDMWYGETALGSTVEDRIRDENGNEVSRFKNTEYYIFPVWWRTNRYGTKDYKLALHQYDKMINTYRVPFNIKDVNKPEDSSIPFPYLGYSTEEIGKDDVLENMSKFQFDDGSFSQAFDMDKAKTIITTGMKVNFNLSDTPEEDNCGIAFYLNSTGPGNENMWSCTQPLRNRQKWGDKYYDQSISHLMYTTVSTMRYQLPEMYFNNLNFDIYGNDDEYAGYSKQPFLIGFTSAPDKEADRSPRDYTDFIMLVIPTEMEFIYNSGDLEDPYIWTLAAEDLGATDDWDFNDVVLHITDQIEDLNTVNRNNIVTAYNGPKKSHEVRVMTVEPVATGGTLPIYVTFSGKVNNIDLPEWGDEWYSVVNKRISDVLGSPYEEGTFIIGTEVHKWLNAPNHTTFVNVGSRRQATHAQKITFAVDPDQDMLVGNGYMNWDYGMGAYGSADDTPLYGFALIVDRDNKLNIDTRESGGFVSAPEIEIGKDTYLIGRPSKDSTAAPQLLFIGGDWQWPTERTKISDAYDQFNTWITAPKTAPWWAYYGEKSKVTAK